MALAQGELAIGSDMLGNPIWQDNVSADPWAMPDQSVDVPGRPDQQSLLARIFTTGAPDAQQRDSGVTAPALSKNISRDQGAEGPGVLSRMWNFVTHPLQAAEDASASAGTAVGKATANAISPVMHSLMPLLILVAVLILGSLWIVSTSGAVRVRA